jgi:hypothetical protein
MADLRAMIREILAEELGRLGHVDAAGSRVETVRIDSDQDLDAFAQRILELASDPHAREAIAAGRHRFRLARSAAAGNARTEAQGQPPAPRPKDHSQTAGTPRFTSGLLTERHVAALGDQQRGIEITAAVRLTPLARDELRRRGISIRRV